MCGELAVAPNVKVPLVDAPGRRDRCPASVATIQSSRLITQQPTMVASRKYAAALGFSARLTRSSGTGARAAAIGLSRSWAK